MEGWTATIAVLVLATAGMAPVVANAGLRSAEVQSTTHHVHIDGFDMDPGSLQIEVGDTVEWHNHDGASHTASADDDSWDTGTIPSGETETITFDETSDDTYHCQFHSSMTGYTLEVVEPNDPPTVSIDEPADGAQLADTVSIEGTALDPDGEVASVEVRIDGGAWQTASGTEAWSYSWDTTHSSDGQHLIEARSFDGTSHSSVASVLVTTDNPQPDLSVQALQTEAAIAEATITTTVTNVGDTQAPSTSLEITYEADNAEGLVAVETIEALDEGETTEAETTWDTRGKVGAFEVTAHVDPDGALADLNADNDRRSQTVCLPGGGQAACLVPGTEAPAS